MPFHKLDAAFRDLDSGDAAGVHTAPVIEVWGLPFSGENWFVGMADDGGDFSLFYPLFKAIIRFQHLAVIPCRTGGVGDSHFGLETFPDVPDNEFSEPPAGVVETVPLVAVEQENLIFLLFVLEKKGFVDG